MEWLPLIEEYLPLDIRGLKGGGSKADGSSSSSSGSDGGTGKSGSDSPFPDGSSFGTPSSNSGSGSSSGTGGGTAFVGGVGTNYSNYQGGSDNNSSSSCSSSSSSSSSRSGYIGSLPTWAVVLIILVSVLLTAFLYALLYYCLKGELRWHVPLIVRTRASCHLRILITSHQNAGAPRKMATGPASDRFYGMQARWRCSSGLLSRSGSAAAAGASARAAGPRPRMPRLMKAASMVPTPGTAPRRGQVLQRQRLYTAAAAWGTLLWRAGTNRWAMQGRASHHIRSTVQKQPASRRESAVLELPFLPPGTSHRHLCTLPQPPLSEQPLPVRMPLARTSAKGETHSYSASIGLSGADVLSTYEPSVLSSASTTVPTTRLLLKPRSLQHQQSIRHIHHRRHMFH